MMIKMKHSATPITKALLSQPHPKRPYAQDGSSHDTASCTTRLGPMHLHYGPLPVLSPVHADHPSLEAPSHPAVRCVGSAVSAHHHHLNCSYHHPRLDSPRQDDAVFLVSLPIRRPSRGTCSRSDSSSPPKSFFVSSWWQCLLLRLPYPLVMSFAS